MEESPDSGIKSINESQSDEPGNVPSSTDATGMQSTTKSSTDAKDVTDSIQDIMSSTANSELKFGLLIGLVKIGDVSSSEVVDSVLHLMVSGQFDMDTNFIIADSNNILHMLELIAVSQTSLQAEIWSIFTAMLKKSRRNLQACTEVGLVSLILDLINKADTIVADLLIDILGVLTSYSITVRELKTLFGLLKAENGQWRRHSVKLLSVLRQMPQKDGPSEFFSFPGSKGAFISLPPIKNWPYQSGWTFSCWLRLDPAAGATLDRDKPYLYSFRTSKGVGYSAHFIGTSLIITAMKVKGKGFQHCIKYDFQPTKWYMVTMAHVYNRWSKSELRCFVDGVMVSYTDMSWFVSSSEAFDKCVIGTNAEGDQDGTFCGQMSTLYLFSDALTQAQVAAMYQLGPGYKSQFRFESESGPNISDQHKKILFDGRLTSAIVFMYNPIACDGQLCLESSPKTNPSYFVHTPHAMMAGDVKAVITHSIHSALHSLGGVQILFPLFGQLDCPVDQGPEEPAQRYYTICSTLIYLLHDLLESSPTIQQQMLQTKGFLVISYLLEKSSREHITPLVLDAFLQITQNLVGSDNNPLLLRNIFDQILFNPGLWIHTGIEVQTKLYCYLATDFIESQIYTNVRRVSSVLQTMHSLKYYYWVVNPQDRSGVTPKGVDGPRPNRDEILKLRSFMLLYTKQLILRGQGILEDELQSMLNYLTTLHEDDNLMDVVEMLTSLMAEHPASLIPAFDTKLGVRTVFKMLASGSEELRLQTLKLLGFFLKRSTHRRKQDSLMIHNLFSLLGERLMLNCTEITMQTYNTLFELLTERMTLEPCPTTMHQEPESNFRLENPAILKVVAIMIKQSRQTVAVLEVKRLFLSDLTILCHNNRDNRRTVLQMSVWQDWLFSRAYIYPRNNDEQKITDAVMTLFRMLLHHAIKYETGGWRVWIDTLAILHSKVSYTDFRLHMSDMYRQYEQNRVDNVTDPDERRQHPVSTISGLGEQNESKDHKHVNKSTVTIKDVTDDDAAKILQTVTEEDEERKDEDDEDNEGSQIDSPDRESSEERSEGTGGSGGEGGSESSDVVTRNENVDAKETDNHPSNTDESTIQNTDNVDETKTDQIANSESASVESDSAHKTDAVAETSNTSTTTEASSSATTLETSGSGTDNSHAPTNDAPKADTQNRANDSHRPSSKHEVSYTTSDETLKRFAQPQPPPQPQRPTHIGPAGDSNVIMSPTRSNRRIIGVTRSDDDNDRFLFSPGFRAAPFRIPEFRWSYLHQKLLSDLLFSIETDLHAWKSHNAKSVVDFVNQSENHVYVVNVTHMISQLADNLITSCGGLLPLLAAATSPNGEVEILEPTQGLSIEQAVSILQRIMNMTDVLVFASSTNFGELEHDKNMPSGGILRQCLRLVCTAAVRNCLECRHRREGRSGETSPNLTSSLSGSVNGGTDPIHSLIHGSSPSQRNIVENLGSQVPSIKDLEKLLQEMDINRLRAVVYRDAEAKHNQFIALAIVYFCSVLMVSKYRDILEPPTPSATPSATPTTHAPHPRLHTASPNDTPVGSDEEEEVITENGLGQESSLEEEEGTQMTEVVVDVHAPSDDAISQSSGTLSPVLKDDNQRADATHETETETKNTDEKNENEVVQLKAENEGEEIDVSASNDEGVKEELEDITVGEKTESAASKNETNISEESNDPSKHNHVVENEENLESDTESKDVEENDSSQNEGSNIDAESMQQEESKIDTESMQKEESKEKDNTDKEIENTEDNRNVEKENTDEIHIANDEDNQNNSQDNSAIVNGVGEKDALEKSTEINKENKTIEDSEITAEKSDKTNEATSEICEGKEGNEGTSDVCEGKEGNEGTSDVCEGKEGNEGTSDVCEGKEGNEGTTDVCEEKETIENPDEDTRAEDYKMEEINLDDNISQPQDAKVLVLMNGEVGESETDPPPPSHTPNIAAISVSDKHQHKPESLDLTARIPETVKDLPMLNEGGSLTERLERALGPVAPLLREVFVDFAPFLSKTLIGSHGQELLIGGLVTLRQSTSVVELVMLLCSQEWQNSLQKHAGLAFIELVNEGRLLAHATRDHIVRVANEAEFILNRLRADDVQKHAEFESLSAETLMIRKEEEKLCDHLITSAKRRDHTIAARHRDKILNILTNKHGPWAEERNGEDYWRLDWWEDDSRRHRRLAKNPYGTSHPEATLKAAIEHGNVYNNINDSATEDAINQACDAVHAHLTDSKRSQTQTTDYTDEELLMDDRDLDIEPTGPLAMATRCSLIAPGVAVIGTMSITKTEMYFEMDDDDPNNQNIDPKKWDEM